MQNSLYQIETEISYMSFGKYMRVSCALVAIRNLRYLVDIAMPGIDKIQKSGYDTECLTKRQELMCNECDK